MQRRIKEIFFSIKPFDRRKSVRFKPQIYISCFCIYVKSGKKKESPSEIIDVSKDGLLLMTGEDKILPPTEVEICFQLPGRQEIDCIQGKIVRTYRRHTENWYYSGIKFTDNQQKGVQSLLDIVIADSRQPKPFL